jgi:hypothetical protein
MPDCAAGCVRRSLWFVLVLSAACERSAPEDAYSPLTAPALALSAPPPPVASTAAPLPLVAAEPGAPPELLAGTFMLQEDILRGLARTRLRRLRPVGSTSTVFRSELDVGFRAAFKTATRLRPAAALNEVAAYRLARCLGLSNVPPALLRRVSKRMLQQALEQSSAARWPELEERMLVDRAGFVEGALIFWIDDLRELGLESPLELTRMLESLQIDGELPAERESLAQQVSTLLAFDWLIGNWDRWSGGNLRGDASGKVLYMRDNDAAFAARLNEALSRRMLEPMQQTQRYSRSFIKALRRLTREGLQRELERDPEYAARLTTHRPLLDARAIDRLFDRRDTLLSHLTALIEEFGEERVLSFP